MCMYFGTKAWPTTHCISFTIFLVLAQALILMTKPASWIFLLCNGIKAAQWCMYVLMNLCCRYPMTSWAGLLPLLTFYKQSGQQHSESQQNQLLHQSWQQCLNPTRCFFQHGARADIKCHLDCLSLLVNELRLRIGASWCTTLAREEKCWWRSQDKTLVIIGGPLWY